MRIDYNGNRINYTGQRTAVLTYNAADNADCQATEYILKVLEINGWPAHPVNVGNTVEIDVADQADYVDLVFLYKDAKYGAKLNAKFFPRPSRLYFPY